MSDIISKVNELIHSKIAFTAYDVTTSLRNDGIRVEHEDVRDEVHSMYAHQQMDPSYERSVKHFGGRKAFIYHHLTADLDEYDPISPTYTKTAASLPVSSVSSISSISKSNRNRQPQGDTLNNAKVRKDNRLNIPKIFIDKLGFQNLKVSVSDNNTIISTLSKQFSKDYETFSIIVQSDGHIQLSKKYLRNTKKYYNIYLKDNCIYVE